MATSNRLRELTPRTTRREGPPAGVFVAAAAAALIAGAGIGIFGYLLKVPGTPQPSISDAVLSATAPRGALDIEPEAPVDDGTWTEADMRACGDEARAARDAAARRKLDAVSANRVGLGAPDSDMVERSTYLLCSVRTKPLHFCTGYWRESLIEAIKKHAADFRKVAGSAYWSKVALADQARRDAERRGEVMSVYEDLDQTTRDVKTLHEGIAEGLRSLVADGVVAREDFGVIFGFGIPPDVAKMLGEAKSVRHRCG